MAIVGMAGSFPGAQNIGELWRLLVNKRQGLARGRESAEGCWWIPNARQDSEREFFSGVVADAYRFEADFFNYSDREAEWTDPQQRLLLQCAFAALESAGVVASATKPTPAGVFVGGEFPAYIANVRPYVESMGDYLQALIGNDKDFLATRVAHRLNLTGPAITVQTACSTSLVAVHQARQSLLLDECDIALAGGVSLQFPQEFGNVYEEGLIYSRDGTTRPFDADAAGTNITSAVGLLVLKRLEDAIADGDSVLAVLAGSAVNNDGADKVGFTAPSAGGQELVIRRALHSAGVRPEDIDFIEAHGTATPLGDAVEVAALRQVFGKVEGKRIALGSIKGNVGHCNRAAGAVGLIKAVLAMHNEVLPSTANHDRPSAQLGLEQGVLYVPTEPTPLPAAARTHRAGVSSFGFGGTNAHVIVEQFPKPPRRPRMDQVQLVTLSADRRDQIDTMAQQLAEYLAEHPETDLADVAYTRNLWRVRRQHVLPFVAKDCEELVQQLQQDSVFELHDEGRGEAGGVAFLFPGHGRRELAVGARLYSRYSVYRRHVDEGLSELDPETSGYCGPG
ncbi:polyketide synthase [Alkalilimnicola ehrlichii]|uniref:Ketosynthase family 3 (KS3) domain-containing protein n=1 Tax=Alkalilimnicola ehrlichii TaxID=351052 RepID=A0A3E0WRI6_9GAMM|nr:polyketide synthase [Alkalilimnicola ehrlichii]RFA34597.1 hypothetical protein CAL65_14625 [Alkalilimnicola ehrlichii]